MELSSGGGNNEVFPHCCGLALLVSSHRAISCPTRWSLWRASPKLHSCPNDPPPHGVPQNVIAALLLGSYNVCAFLFFCACSWVFFSPWPPCSRLNEQMERVNQEKPCRPAWLHPNRWLGNAVSRGINALANTLQVLFTGKPPFECQMGCPTEQNLDVWVPAAEDLVRQHVDFWRARAAGSTHSWQNNSEAGWDLITMYFTFVEITTVHELGLTSLPGHLGLQWEQRYSYAY